MNNTIDLKATAVTKARYNRIARIYDLMETMSENRFKPWREKLWSYARADSVTSPQDTRKKGESIRNAALCNILEVGVGTGKNFPYHPCGSKVTGIDLADQMLARARERARLLGAAIELREGDAQALDFPDNSFDIAAATFVYCSVPDPIRGLCELNRVVKPGGRILLLDHVRIDRPIIGRAMDLLNPLIVRLWGANVNRRTVENVQRAGLEIEYIEHLGPMQMVKLIVARPKK